MPVAIAILLGFIALIHGFALGYLVATHRANVRSWDAFSGRKEGI
jgi:uncharacterized protein YneF (UPF0154 family)